MDGSIALEAVGKPAVGLANGPHVGGINHLQLIVAHHETQLLTVTDVVGGIVIHNTVVVKFGDSTQQRLTTHTTCKSP